MVLKLGKSIWENRAAAGWEIFTHNNPQYRNYNYGIIDPLTPCNLRGLKASPAKRYMSEHIDLCKQASVQQAVFLMGRIPSLIAKMLTRKGVSYQEGVPNEGCVTVRIPS